MASDSAMSMTSRGERAAQAVDTVPRGPHQHRSSRWFAVRSSSLPFVVIRRPEFPCTVTCRNVVTSRGNGHEQRVPPVGRLRDPPCPVELRPRTRSPISPSCSTSQPAGMETSGLLAWIKTAWRRLERNFCITTAASAPRPSGRRAPTAPSRPLTSSRSRIGTELGLAHREAHRSLSLDERCCRHGAHSGR
jgi:hypothetical protein